MHFELNLKSIMVITLFQRLFILIIFNLSTINKMIKFTEDKCIIKHIVYFIVVK